MNIKIRRVILTVFLLFFFTMAPILILYTSGYRFDFKKGELIKTGSLFIETPTIKNTDIFINDKLYKEQLNKKIFIKNLLPNKYKITLKKESRYLWEKEINISPSLTTFIKDVILFLQTDPVELRESMSFANIIASPNKEFLAYYIQNDDTQNYYILNIASNTEKKIYSTKNLELPTLSWSANSKNILITSKDTVIVNTNGDITITPINAGNKIRWNISDNNTLSVLGNNEISYYKIDTKKLETIIKTQNDIIDVMSDSLNYFYIENTENESLLKQHNKTFDSTILIAKLNKSDNYKFIDISNDNILIKNASNAKVVLIKRPLELNYLELQNNVVQFDALNAVFSNNKNSILLYNDFELKNYGTSDKKLTLIDRYSKEIQSANWSDDNDHVLIGFNDSIIISDLNSNTKTSKIELLNNMSNLKNLNILNSKYLLFSASQVDKQIIYLLQID